MPRIPKVPPAPKAPRAPKQAPAPEVQVPRRSGPLPIAPDDPRALQYGEGEEDLAKQIVARLESQDPDFAIGPGNPLRRLFAAVTEGDHWGGLLNTTKVRGVPDSTETIWDYLNSVATQGGPEERALVKYLLNEGAYQTKRELPHWWERVPTEGLDSRVAQSLIGTFAAKLNQPAVEVDADVGSGAAWSPSTGMSSRGSAAYQGKEGEGRWDKVVGPAELLDDPIAHPEVYKDLPPDAEDPRTADPLSQPAPSDKSVPRPDEIAAASSEGSRVIPKQFKEMQQQGLMPKDPGKWLGRAWDTTGPLDVEAPPPPPGVYDAIVRAQDEFAGQTDAGKAMEIIGALRALSPDATAAASDRILALKKARSALKPKSGIAVDAEGNPFTGSDTELPAYENPSLYGRPPMSDENTAIAMSYLDMLQGEALPQDPDQAAALQKLRELYVGNEAEFLDTLFAADRKADTVDPSVFSPSERVVLPRSYVGKQYKQRAANEFFPAAISAVGNQGDSSAFASQFRESGIGTDDLQKAHRYQDLIRRLIGEQAGDMGSDRALDPSSPEARYTSLVHRAAGGDTSALAYLLEPRKYQTYGKAGPNDVDAAFEAGQERLQPGGSNRALEAAYDSMTVAKRLAEKARAPHLAESLANQIEALYPNQNWGGDDAIFRGLSVNPEGLLRYNELKAEKELRAIADPELAAEEEMKALVRKWAARTPLDPLPPRPSWSPDSVDPAAPGQPATGDGLPVAGPMPPEMSRRPFEPEYGPPSQGQWQLAEANRIAREQSLDRIPPELLEVELPSMRMGRDGKYPPFDPYAFPSADTPPFPGQAYRQPAREIPLELQEALRAAIKEPEPVDRIRAYAAMRPQMQLPLGMLLHPEMESALSGMPEQLQAMQQARAPYIARSDRNKAKRAEKAAARQSQTTPQ